MLEGLATSTAAISDQTASTTDVPTKILLSMSELKFNEFVLMTC